MRHSRSKPIGWAFFLLAVQLASSATGRPEEPPAPEPSPAVRQLLDRTEELLKERKAAEVLVLADQALAEADTAQDAAGRALAHAARARALQALERPGEAVAAWRDAEVTWEEAGDVPGRIDALCSQAILLAVQEPDEAARSLNRVLALARQATERPLALIASLNRAGRRLTRVDRLADAKSLSEAALELGEVHAPGSLEVAASLDNLGNVAWFQGDLTTARNRHVRALELREKHSAGSTDVATSLNNLGNVVREQGDLAAARDLYVRALEIKEKQAPGSLDLAASLNNLGIVARMQGDFTTARDYHLRAFEINEKQAPASLSVADSLNLLGNLARAQGDLPTARDYLLRALEIREKRVPGSRYVAESFANLGAVAGLQGDLAAARDFFLRALDFYEDHSPGSLEVALSLNDLGAVAGLQGDLAAARDYFLRALKIQEEHAPGSLDVATSLNNLGTLTRDEGDFATAWDLHLRALEINEKHAPSSLGVAESLSNLGTVAREQGDLAAARDYYLRALKIQEEHAPGSLDVAASLNKLGNVAFKLGEFDSARDSLEEAWRIVRRQAGAVTGDEARRAFEATHADYATDVIRSKLALGRSAEALETLEQGRARALLQMLALRGLPALLSEEALAPFYKARHALEQAQAELDGAGTAEGQAQAELKQLRAGRVPTDDVTEKERELAAATASRKERAGECTRLRVVMEQELANVRRLLPGGLGEDSLPLDQARRSLPEQALFVAFSVGEDETSVFLVPADHEAAVTAYTVQVRSDDLARRVEAIVEHTRSHKASRPAMLENERLLAARGRELYATLFPREVQPLLDSAQRLLISPDGPLWELPLAALALPGSGDEVRWLGLEKPLAYAHSLSVYAREKARPQSAATASVIVGDPIYSRTKQPGELVARVASAMRGERSYLYADGRPPDQLPWTGEEARQIGRLYGTSPLVGDDATERAVREQIGAARLVHLATHGYFHPEMPMSSGVLLSLPDSDDAPRAADGTLQAWEFASQIRMDADLLVLSACETGRGRLVPGEGLIGLTRAVQIAGARSVVATHWRIDDSSAAQIMVAFHEALRGGAAKDDALRLAMRDVQASNPTREPYYWAGFLLVGDIGAAAGAAATEQPRDPPGPEPSPAVRQLLDRAEGMLGDRKAAEVLALADQALALADQALAAADTIEDVAGRALAHAARARSFETLERPGEAVAAWRDAEVAWEEAGDVPGRIDALCSQAILLGGQEPDQAARLLDRALATARQESKRPLAAIASLNRGGDALAKAGRLNEAKSLSEAALALGEARAPGSLDVARSLNGLGNVAYREGDLVVARDFYLRALEIQEKRAPGSLDVARCLNGLGNVAWSEGDLVAAVDFYLRALEIREKHAPSLDVAASFNNLGTVAGDQGDLVAARDYHLRALAIREKHAPGSLDVAMSLNNLGTVAHDQGDLVAARDYYQRALAIEERHAPGSLDVAASLNNLGIVAGDQGDLVAARDYHLRALAIREKHAPGSLDVAMSLNNLGTVAHDQGDLVAARDYYQRALAIEERHAPGSLAVAASLNNLSNVANDQGDLVAARDYHLRALAIREKHAPGSLAVAMSLDNLGTVAHDQGDLVAARDYYQRALAIEERHAPGSLAVAGSLNNLGAVADDQGDLVAARDYHLRALAIREKHAPDSLDVAASLDNLGVVARNRGDLVAARDDYLRALAIREKHAPGSLDVASSLNHLGTVAFKLGDVDSARDSLERAWGIVRRQAGLVTGDEARRAFEARHAEHAIDLIRAQLALGRSAEALETLEQGRAQALLQMVALRGLPELLSAEALAPYHKARHELEQAQAGLDEAGAAEGKADAALKALRGVSDPTDELAQREQELATARAAREEQTRVYTRLRVEMEEELARVRSLLPGGVGEEPLPLEQSRRALAAGALFVAFSVGEEDTAVFFVPADSEAQLLSYTVPIGSDELSRRVQSIVALAGTHRAARPAMLDSERRLAAEGRELYAALFSAEAAQALLESARQLLISPDGPLWELPFAALALPGGGDPVRWLGLEKPLAYEHSLSVHAREKARPRAAVTTASVIVGDPTYSRETAPGASAEAASAVRGERSYLYADGKPPARLPWTGEEARQIGRLYGTSPLVGGAATEGAVRERIDEAGLVHLATHGYFHPEMPMSSGVLLAVPEPDAVTTDADGMLQAWEFASQIHMNSDLVVLSACETGRGGRVQGEGLVGLTRAVRIAGARSIVATHWKIDDESAKEIMLAFHEALRGGAAKDEALRQAMRKAQAQSATRAPYYWAGFLLVGDVEARPQS